MSLFKAVVIAVRAWFRGLSDRWHKVPLRLQKQQDDCGLACLEMIAEYLNINAAQQSLLAQMKSYGRALTIGDLLNIADSFGISTQTQRLSVTQVKAVQSPVILHWCDNHFVVLVNQSWAGVVINDPAKGRRIMNWRAFARHYSGVCIRLHRPSGSSSAHAVSSDSYQEIPRRLS